MTVIYTCEYGFTHTGKYGDRNVKTVTCGYDGKFQQEAPVCMPVVCGKPPVIDHGKLMKGFDPDKEINFASKSQEYECDLGYSTDVEDNPYGRQAEKFALSCMGTGEWPIAPKCVNIDDCLVHSCGDDGKCKDRQADRRTL
jgi:hypothetical protein